MMKNKDADEEIMMPHINNFCAKHMNTFNKPATHKDKKRSMKNGERKHKTDFKEQD